MKKILVTTILAGFLIFSVGFVKGVSASNAVKLIKIAVTNSAIPFDYIDENGKATGYDVDVLKEIDKRLKGYNFQIDSLDQTAVLLGVETGKYALGASNFFKNPDREKKFLFPDENSDLSLVKLAVRKERNDINSLGDLVGKKLVPIPANDGLYSIVKEYNEKNSNKQVKLETIDSIVRADAMKWVDSGRYDAYLVPSVGFKVVQKQLNLDLKLTNTVKRVPTYFILNKNEKKFKATIDKVLKKLKRDGTLSKLSLKWFDEDVFKE